MFLPSAATDTLQGQAINKVNEVWGEDKHRGWDNYKSLGMPVCKKKYRPFNFTLKRKNPMGGIDIKVVRMYGCACHSNLRKEIIEKHGERNGWEPFGQWSLGKAKAAARREVMKLNAQLGNSCSNLSAASSSSGYTSSSSSEEFTMRSKNVIRSPRITAPAQRLAFFVEDKEARAFLLALQVSEAPTLAVVSLPFPPRRRLRARRSPSR